MRLLLHHHHDKPHACARRDGFLNVTGTMHRGQKHTGRQTTPP